MTIKVLEWNINKRSTCLTVKSFVCEEILKENADVVCLTEYTDDDKIKQALSDTYWIQESISSSGNQILIAVKKTFAYKTPIIIRNQDELECYNLLHVKIETNIKDLSIVGIRMLTGTGKNAINARKQTSPLNKYLSEINEDFICMGDFNIQNYRMKHWFPEFMTQKNNATTEIEKYSFLFSTKEIGNTISSMGALDHILTKNNCTITSKYKWDFVEKDEIYPKMCNIKKGCCWDIPPSFPDHAKLMADVIINDEK